MESHENVCNVMQTYAPLCKSLSIYSFLKNLIFAAPFEEIEEEADEDISWDLREDPPPRVSAPPLSDGVRHEEPMPIFAEVPSERLLGESRREELKRKTEHLSRSLCESFSFVTSKTIVYQRFQGCYSDIWQCELTGSG